MIVMEVVCVIEKAKNINQLHVPTRKSLLAVRNNDAKMDLFLIAVVVLLRVYNSMQSFS